MLRVTPVELPSTTKSSMMTTVTLSKWINSLMKKTFKDYLGCKIYPVLNDQYSGMHPVRCDLVFTLGSDNLAGSTIAAFKPVADPVQFTKTNERANYTEIISGHNARLANLNAAEITQDAIDIVHPLLWNNIAMQTKETAAKYKERGIVKEQSTPTPYNLKSQIITPIISFVDINAIMSTFVHGAPIDEKGRRFDDIMIQPIRSIVSMNPQQAYGINNYNMESTNFLFLVNQLDKEVMSDVANEIGFINKAGYADCYTESFS